MTGFATAETLWRAVLAYAGIGLLVGVLFLAIGLPRVAPSARGAYAFRPLLLPGLALLWPLVAWRWAVLAREPQPIRLGRHYARTQRAAWMVLAVLLPLVLVATLALRQSGPIEAAPVRLAP